MTIQIIHGDCRLVMATLPAESVDSVVCDPPYELGFMGRKWDSSGVAFDPKTWEAALRVLKPGGHLLAFSGTRTYHRMACAIEDAGFDIRDQVGWLFGSGFPKSMDVSKAIDKIDAVRDRTERALRFTEWVRSTGLSSARIDEITGTNMGGHYTTAASQPAVATREHLEMLRPFLPPVPDWVEEYVNQRVVASETYKQRPVVGEHEKQAAAAVWRERYDGGSAAEAKAITTAFTPEAQQWAGWGTALKPAWEPVCVARKPFRGSVADNVLKHGTAALNIAACTVGDEVRTTAPRDFTPMHGNRFGDPTVTDRPPPLDAKTYEGRWPANVMHDGSPGVMDCFPTTAGYTPGKAAAQPGRAPRAPGATNFQMQPGVKHPDGGGSAARFFAGLPWSDDDRAWNEFLFHYTGKASKGDRNQGIDDLPEVAAGGMSGRNDGTMGSVTMNRNHHPTVKPTALMLYLVRLVTPPGGTVLDPFMGSGSTLKAAELGQFSAIGIELDPSYIEIARRRIAGDAPLFRDVEVSAQASGTP